jgi:hypothetical protein
MPPAQARAMPRGEIVQSAQSARAPAKVAQAAAAAPAPAAPTRRELQERTMRRDYAAEMPPVDLSDYFMGVMSQIKDDPVLINPSGAQIQTSDGAGPDDSDTQAIVQAITQVGAHIPTYPIGHAAISDTRIYFDTLAIPAAYPGNPNGEIQVRFADLNSTTSPERVVKIALTPFQFPHIYTADTTIFDMFYFGTVFMTIRSIPNTQLTQTRESDMQFTFELRVDNPDSNSLYLTPLEPTFYLTRPLSLLSDLAVQFRVKTPGGGYISCPLPPIQVRVRRTLAPPLGPTTFAFVDPTQYIGIIAPPGVLYTVPVLFTALQTTLVPNQLVAGGITRAQGWVSSTFVQTPPTFNIAWDSSAIPFPANPASDDINLFIPKNSFGFALRFSSVNPSETNDLFPVHF